MIPPIMNGRSIFVKEVHRHWLKEEKTIVFAFRNVDISLFYEDFIDK